MVGWFISVRSRDDCRRLYLALSIARIASLYYPCYLLYSRKEELETEENQASQVTNYSEKKSGFTTTHTVGFNDACMHGRNVVQDADVWRVSGMG